MARSLDLDKVEQAWNLRRQGKQQKEIAEDLGLSLRHIQNYLSIDWLSQRGMRALMKGGAQEVNDQLRALGRLGEIHVNGAGEDAANGEAQGTSSCNAPEQWADVGRLERWGVPKYSAPGVLGAWRMAHRDGAHELCAMWVDLVNNVQADVPFPDAYDLTIAGWLADRWGMPTLKSITELYRLYRPWESKVHRKVYLDEVRSIIGDGASENGSNNGSISVEELPQRFLYGLPRRPMAEGRSTHSADYDDNDD